MAVFKTDLSFTTIQDKQLKALESLDSTLSDEYSVSKDIYEELESINNNIFKSTDILLHGIDAIWSGREFKEFSNRIDTNYSSLSDNIRISTEELSNEFREGLEDLADSVDQQSEDNHVLEILLEDIFDIVKDLGSKVLNSTIDSANTWSELYNQTLRFTGVSGEEAQQFRKNIIDRVDTLSSELGSIGGKLNPQEIMDTMISISNNTNISNLNTLESLVEPVVLAQQTTNLSLNELSKLGARMYNRYGFTSESLESLVGTIRANTEGQDVSEDDILRAIEQIETRLGIFYEGDATAIQQASESLSAGIAFLESNYVNADPYAEDIYKLFSTNVLDQQELMRRYSNYDEILYYAKEQGNIAKAMELMLVDVSKRGTIEATSTNIGISQDTSEEAQLWAQTGKTLDEFYESVKDSGGLRERAAEKFVSIEEQISNQLTGITGYLASIQEDLGIGFSDMTLAVSVLGNVLPPLLGDRGSTRGLGGLLRVSGGAAIGIGAAMAGVALAVGTISDSVKTLEEIESQLYSERNASLDEGIHLDEESVEDVLGYMYKYTYDGNQKVWEQVLVNKADYTDEYGNVDLARFEKDKSSAQEAYNKDMIAEASDAEGFWQNALDIATLGIAKAVRVGVAEKQVRDNNKFSKIQDESIGSELWQTYVDNNLLENEDQIDIFTKNYDRIKELYSEGKVLLTDGSKTVVNAKDLRYPPSYDVGTNYVPYDQLAYVHEGEAIIPAKYNPANSMNELDKFRTNSNDNTVLSSILEELSDIKEYLQYWKTDSDRQSTIQNTRQMSMQRSGLLSFNT